MNASMENSLTTDRLLLTHLTRHSAGRGVLRLAARSADARTPWSADERLNFNGVLRRTPRTGALGPVLSYLTR